MRFARSSSRFLALCPCCLLFGAGGDGWVCSAASETLWGRFVDRVWSFSFGVVSKVACCRSLSSLLGSTARGGFGARMGTEAVMFLRWEIFAFGVLLEVSSVYGARGRGEGEKASNFVTVLRSCLWWSLDGASTTWRISSASTHLGFVEEASALVFWLELLLGLFGFRLIFWACFLLSCIE